MIGQLLEIPFGEFEGTSAVKLSLEAQNGDKMQIVSPETCEYEKFSVPLRSQSTAERLRWGLTRKIITRTRYSKNLKR